MKIGIDARPLQNGHTVRGIGSYTKNIIEALSRVDNVNDYFLISDNQGVELFFSGNNFHHLILDGCNNSLWDRNRIKRHIVLPLELKKSDFDLIFFPTHLEAPCLWKGRTVVGVLDMISREGWNSKGRLKDIFERREEASILKSADRIITISNYSKNKIVELVGIEQRKVEVTLLGVDSNFKPIDSGLARKSMIERYKIESDFILFVGRVEKRKNIEGILKSFQYLKRRHSLEEIKLVIAGDNRSNHDLDSALEKFVDGNKVLEDIILVGYVDTEELVKLYNASVVFLFPSLSEGFGLPVLEAMACGTPVITSDRTSLPEVAGEAAKLVNPDNVNQITDAVIQIIEDVRLRKQMVTRGLERAKLFSWEKTATDTMTVFEDVMKN